MQDSPQRFGTVAIVLHWTIALLILLTLPAAWYANTLDNGVSRTQVLAIHKSIGIAIFILAIVRLAWRMTHRVPGYPQGMPAWQRMSATATHVLLYGLILAMPITGYIADAARGRDTMFFGIFPVPTVVPLDRKLSFYAESAHSYAQYVLYVLVAIHVGAAFYHQLVVRDGVLNRMWPSTPRRSTNVS